MMTLNSRTQTDEQTFSHSEAERKRPSGPRWSTIDASKLTGEEREAFLAYRNALSRGAPHSERDKVRRALCEILTTRARASGKITNEQSVSVNLMNARRESWMLLVSFVTAVRLSPRARNPEDVLG